MNAAVWAAKECLENGESLRVVLKYGVDPEVRDNYNRDAFYIASEYKRDACKSQVDPCREYWPFKTWIEWKDQNGAIK